MFYDLAGIDMYKKRLLGVSYRLLATLVITLGLSPSHNCQAGQPQLSVAVQATGIFSELKAAEPASVLPKGALVLVTGETDPTGRFRQIQISRGNGSSGWVKTRDLVAVADAFIAQKAKSVVGDQLAKNSETNRDIGVPLLIQFSNHPNITQIYEEAFSAYSENQKLPDEEKIPEPYFARAEIWHLVGNYPDAVVDLVDGVKYARARGRNPKLIEEYHNKMAMVLEKIKTMPRPMGEPASEFHAAAVSSYGKGLHSLKAKRLSAARYHFNDAIRLDPDVPVYWYLRAVTNHRDGRELEARHDAVMGNFFERDVPFWKGRRIAKALTGIQGPDRAWLESYRDGTALQSLYGL